LFVYGVEIHHFRVLISHGHIKARFGPPEGDMYPFSFVRFIPMYNGVIKDFPQGYFYFKEFVLVDIDHVFDVTGHQYAEFGILQIADKVQGDYIQFLSHRRIIPKKKRKFHKKFASGGQNPF
jgi:hypothetical protein